MRDTTFTVAPLILIIAGVGIMPAQMFFGLLCLGAAACLLIYLPGEKE